MSLALSSFLQLVAIFILLGWGIYLVYRAGQIYNGPVYTMAIGAYFSAYAARDLGWPFGLALVTAVGLGALASYLPALRLSKASAFATAIATIALIFIGQTVIRNLDFLGGAYGFCHIPRVEHLIPLSWIFVAIIGFFIYRLDHSHVGRAMEVIFVDRDVAASLGIDIRKVRLYLQVASGMIGALAGVLYAFNLGTIQVADFNFSLLLFSYCFLFVGGSTTMWGVLIFTPVLWALSVFLPQGIAAWRDIIYGSLLITILVLRPNGVIDKDVLRVVGIKSRAWLGRLTTHPSTGG